MGGEADDTDERMHTEAQYLIDIQRKEAKEKKLLAEKKK